MVLDFPDRPSAGELAAPKELETISQAQKDSHLVTRTTRVQPGHIH